MNCIVTAGPTYERLDEVRRLTNFSTGRLGAGLSNFLVARGHHVTLLLGEQATWSGERHAQRVETFTTTADLKTRLEALAGEPVDAMFHAAAVSDFSFGKVWERTASGELIEVKAGKISTRHGTLLAELAPTPKLIENLRGWFPRARLTGWKYEMDGDRESAVARAKEQLNENHTDACVANGRAYGPGFGLITLTEALRHFDDPHTLFAALETFAAG